MPNNYIYEEKALRCAILFGQTDIVKLLLNDKRVDPKGVPLLENACSKHRLSTVKLLLDSKRVDPGANKNQALITAVKPDYDIENATKRQNQFELVKRLLADKRINPGKIDKNKLEKALDSRDYTEVFTLFLQANPKVEPHAPLTIALKHSSNDFVILLLNTKRIAKDSLIKFILEDKYSYSNTIFYWVESLLDDKRALRMVCNNETLQGAIKYGYTPIVQRLLNTKHISPSLDYNTALITAIETKYLCYSNHSSRKNSKEVRASMVRCLLNLDEKYLGSETRDRGLVKAISLGKKNIVELLLKDKLVSLDARRLGLQQAIKLGNKDIVKCLLNDGKNSPKNLNLALQQAISLGNLELVEYLLANKHVDPAMDKQAALIKAIIMSQPVNGSTANEQQQNQVRKQRKIIECLLKHPNVNIAADDYKVVMLAADLPNIAVLALLCTDPRIIGTPIEEKAYTHFQKRIKGEVSAMYPLEAANFRYAKTKAVVKQPLNSDKTAEAVSMMNKFTQQEAQSKHKSAALLSKLGLHNQPPHNSSKPSVSETLKNDNSTQQKIEHSTKP